MNETKSIDWISEFIVKNKSEIHSIDIGYPASDTVRIYMNDEKFWEFWIKETSPIYHYPYSLGLQISMNNHRRFNWVDVLLIHLRCDMNPPPIHVYMYYTDDPILLTETRRDPGAFLMMLQLKDYSIELNERLLNFIMGDPGLICCTMIDSAERYVSQGMNGAAVRSVMMRRYGNRTAGIPRGATLSRSGIMEINKRYIDPFISGLVKIREPVIKERIEDLISDEEVSPELKMFFIRWKKEHLSFDENETLRL